MQFMDKIKKWIRFIMFYCFSCLYSLKYPMKDNKVCFLSDVRTTMGGNLKCVYDYLEDKEFERVIEFKADRRVRRTFKDKLKLIYMFILIKIKTPIYGSFFVLITYKKGNLN